MKTIQDDTMFIMKHTNQRNNERFVGMIKMTIAVKETQDEMKQMLKKLLIDNADREEKLLIDNARREENEP